MKKIIFSAALISVLFSCKTEKQMQQTTTDEKQHIELELPETISSEDIGDDIFVYTIKIGNDPEKSHLTASLPITLYDFVNKSEERLTQEFITEFKNEFEIQENGAILDFNQHFDVKFHSEDFLTFLYSQNASYGNNYGEKHFVSVFDLKNKKKIQPQDFFTNEENFIAFSAEIQSLVKKAIRERIYADKNYSSDQEREEVLQMLQESIQVGTAANATNYNALFFNEKGQWIVIFEKYQVASGAMGEFVIEIPKEISDKYIDQKFLNLFKKEAPEQVVLEPSQPVYTEVDCSKVPCVALTFDDGPSVYTPQLLDALKTENVKATFFVLGKSASVQKNTLKRIADEGHNIGNHSYDHKDFRKISEDEAIRQITLTDEIIEGIVGEKPRYFRFPYGAHTQENLAMVGRPVIGWNVDPMDWKFRDVQQVVEGMSKGSKQAIILAHDIHKTTVEAIPQVIKNLKAQGYHIVSLDDLFRYKKLKNGQTYSNGK